MKARIIRLAAAALLTGGSFAFAPAALATDAPAYPPTTPQPTVTEVVTTPSSTTSVEGVKTGAPAETPAGAAAAPSPGATPPADPGVLPADPGVADVKLPATGASVVEWAVIGGAAVLLGAALTIGARTRRRA